MKKLLIASLVMTASTPTIAAQISDTEAKNAYIYAYSIEQAYNYFYETMVETDYPVNQFQNIRHLADDTYTSHVSINNDTLHLMGWLDVAAEPVIVSVPDMDANRYWLLHTMDMGHYTDSMIGSRTRDTKGGQFMYASPNWKGEVPDSVDEVIYVQSDLVKLMGRIMATDAEDSKIARDYMDEWNIRTLSQYLGEKGPKQKVRQYPDPKTSNWLEITNFALCEGNMGKADQSWLKQYPNIGLEACKTDFTKEQLAAAKVGKELGMKHLQELAPKMVNSLKLLGTRDVLSDGDRDLFAEGTLIGQWGLPAIEASYRNAVSDVNGKQLSGANGQEYTMTFKAPDVSEFWSVTAYASDNRLMAHNDINRHSRGDRTLKADKDGNYTIKFSADVAANKDDVNFLPIPEKDFYLLMRFYGASDDIQSGEYQMAPLTPIK